MTTRMLIDARHPEETRVAVLNGNRIEEFDFESADHKQIKGNIYLAKVTRVEPSLQAAFVDFGGNRHGFLAFSEIHPDYYQIPKQDRDALLAEEAAHAEEEAALRAEEEAEEDAADEESGEEGSDDADGAEALADELVGDDDVRQVDTREKDHVATIEGGRVSNGHEDDAETDVDADAEAEADADAETDADSASESDTDASARGDDGESSRGRGRGRRQGRAQAHGARGQADAVRDKRMALRRRYKIQDVIHRRQVLLVQVVKEERGNKGAALTTYLSLAGRYCVLMPNSSHSGGISRKISSAADRKRLKSIIAEMNLPKSMGCIVRTAGLSRTKPEIKRDFDYLARLWDEIRERTLKSSAPALIHSDSDLVKRAIRDIYNKEIEEVVVEGEAGYRAAKDFMKLLMPSHARRVKQYANAVPLFQRYGAEDQLTAMYDPVVQLRSGGYLVINPTEALVSIDINSGRSTKEHGIEATALNTNLEAAREIARQLRLRDMAGLVVIDFIDMEYTSNVRKVEKCMKDALKNDRARIQIGRISGFGLMEMSRQRLRTGVLEATTRSCPHCDGSGLVRTASSAGLSALRLIEDEAAKGKGSLISLYASQEAAIYLLNAKRADLAEIEARYGVAVEVLPDGENEGAKMRTTSSGPRPEFVPRFEPIPEPEDDDLGEDQEAFEEADEDGDERGEQEPRPHESERDEDGGGRKRRKRRRGGRGREQGDGEPEERAAQDTADSLDDSDEADPANGERGHAGDDGDGEGPRKRRRRGRRRRGGRDRDGSDESTLAETAEDADATVDASDEADAPDDEATPDDANAPAEAGDDARSPDEVVEQPGEDLGAVEAADEAPSEPTAKPRTRRRKTVPDESFEDGEAPAAEAPRKQVRRSRKPASPEGEAPNDGAEPAAKPRRSRRKAEPVEASPVDEPHGEETRPDPIEAAPPTPEPQSAADRVPAPADREPAPADGEPPRRGWWQRTFGA